jgi:hypothetical protein
MSSLSEGNIQYHSKQAKDQDCLLSQGLRQKIEDHLKPISFIAMSKLVGKEEQEVS